VATLLLARSLAEMGERDAAFEKLASLEHAAKNTLVAPEAARARLQIAEPLAAASIDAAMRAASEPGVQDLDAVAARARRLGEEHDSWVAHLAAAMAERRLGRHARARIDALRALALAPSAPAAHLEMAVLMLATKDPAGAVSHAKRATELDPAAARAHAVLAEALYETGAQDEAIVAIERAHALAPDDAHIASARARISAEKRRPSWVERLFKR
jgi:tetratricopeptide (TPR) repeat protein